MAFLNENYLKLKAGYLFPEIERRVKEYQSKFPEKKIISMGIGDVTQPLAPSVVKAFHEAVDEMGNEANFKGYGPYQGYAFLRQAIIDNEYKARGIELNIDDIFISDGSKCDTANILDIFGRQNKIAISDPVYPVYVDTNVMDGRTGAEMPNSYFEGLVYMPCAEENNFLPQAPKEKVDIIYLCFPNNPTGMAISKAELKKWVDYAIENKLVPVRPSTAVIAQAAQLLRAGKLVAFPAETVYGLGANVPGCDGRRADLCRKTAPSNQPANRACLVD